MGKKSCDMIQETLLKYYDRVGITIVDNMDDLERLVSKQPDIVFLGMKKLPGSVTNEDPHVWISAYLSERGINYTGSTQPAIALDYDKNIAKEYVRSLNLSTAKFFTALPGQYTSQQALPLQFPLFIKPSSEGGGSGIDNDSVVHTFQAFEAKVESIYTRFGTLSLIEEYLTGREFSVALLAGTNGEQLKAMPIELVAAANERGDRILGKDVKKEDSERVMSVAPGEARDRVIQLATDIFLGLGGRDYGRIDIRMDAHGNPFFLEANLVPGLIRATSYFTKACFLNEAMSYESMLRNIVEVGLTRSDDLSVEESDLLLSLENSFLNA